jgi:serine/threonine-protein kinase RsbW
VSDALPIVELRLLSTPETLTLVRGVLGALSELLAVDAELLDDMKTAISEAANNVVMHAYAGEAGPLEVTLTVSDDGLGAVIRDEGAGIPDAVDAEDGVHGVGMPLIKALTDEVEFLDRQGGGTEVRMRFPLTRSGRALFTLPAEVAHRDAWAERLSGDAVVSLSPVSFLGPVLGRLARALAARARFSLDRFSDVYLVTDAMAAHAAGSASSGRVGFAIATEPRRLEITLGPLRNGSASALQSPAAAEPVEATPGRDATSALRLLSDEVEAQPDGTGEILRVVMTDRAERFPAL